MAEAYNNRISGAGSPVDPRPGSSLDSLISKLGGACSAIVHLTARVEQLANTTMGEATSDRPPAQVKIDHPPCTLQEHMAYLEDNISRLEAQIQRFF